MGPGSPGWPYHYKIHYTHTHFLVKSCIQNLRFLHQLQVFQKLLLVPAVEEEYRWYIFMAINDGEDIPGVLLVPVGQLVQSILYFPKGVCTLNGMYY